MVTPTTHPVNSEPSEQFKGFVVEAAEGMTEKAWQPRLHEAMDIVLTGAVDLARGKVRSGKHAYEVNPRYGCACPDARLRNRFCEHFVAFEMQKRVEARMFQSATGAEDMPVKAKAAPRGKWDASVQNGQGGDGEPALFEDPTRNPAPELDDILGPEAPEPVQQAVTETFGPNGIVRTEGHQHVTYPSMLCIERQIGMTKLKWAFGGADDIGVWARADIMIRHLDEAAKRYAPPPAKKRRSTTQG